MMIPVETGMYSNPTAPNFAAPIQGYEQGQQMRLRDLQMQQQTQQQQMEGIKLSDMTRAAQFQQAMRNSYSVDPDTGQLAQDPAKMNAAAQIDPMAYSAFKQQQNAVQLKAAQDQAEMHHVQLGDMASILGRATDDTSYQSAVKQATTKGYLHEGELPDTYAEATAPGPNGAQSPLQQHLATTLSYQDQLKQKMDQQKADAESAKANASVSEADTKAKALPFEAQKAAAETTKANASAAEVGVKRQDLSIQRDKFTQDKQSSALQQTQQELESARGNQAVQQAQMDHYAAKKVNTLVNQFSDPNQMNPNMVSLVASEVAKMAQGGSPTLDTLKEIRPETIKGSFAESAQKFTNEPTPANQGAFIRQMQQYATNLDGDARNMIQDKVNRVLNVRQRTLNPDDYATLKANYADKLMGETAAPTKTPTKSGGSADYHSMSDSDLMNLYNKRVGGSK